MLSAFLVVFFNICLTKLLLVIMVFSLFLCLLSVETELTILNNSEAVFFIFLCDFLAICSENSAISFESDILVSPIINFI